MLQCCSVQVHNAYGMNVFLLFQANRISSTFPVTDNHVGKRIHMGGRGVGDVRRWNTNNMSWAVILVSVETKIL